MHVRHGADVILVAVGEDQRLHLGAARLDVGQVRNDQIDAELVGVGEHHAGVDQDGRVLPGHAIMFMPNSPRPPRGTTSSVAGDTSGTAD